MNAFPSETTFPGQSWLHHPRWEETLALAERMVTDGQFRAVAFQAYCQSASPEIRWGTQKSAQSQSPALLNQDSLFLVASLTKPVVATLVLQLVEQGLIGLNERICEHLPEWNRNERRRITLRHLLCHTSGLPDQLPNNLELRSAHAGLEEFYRRVVDVPLEFPPGSQARYQSMGFVVLAELLRKLTGLSLEQLAHQRIFQPLGMHDTYLGLTLHPDPQSVLSRVVEVELDEEQQRHSGNWNSSYWQSLGAPWGGMLSTPADMLKFCRSLPTIAGSVTAGSSLKPPLTQAMCSQAMGNQLVHFEDMNPRDRSFRPWGLGWRLNWPAHRETFGDALSPQAVGHWGATGALMVCDPARKAAFVLCTSRPIDRSAQSLIRLANSIVTSWESTTQEDCT